MKAAILAFDKINNPTRRAVLDGPDSEVVQKFRAMKASRQPVKKGLPVVELWLEAGGFRERYFAEETKDSLAASRKESQ